MKTPSLLLVSFCIVISSFSFGNNVDVTTAKKVGINFLKKQGIEVHDPLQLQETRVGSGKPLFYIFNNEDKGFIIVSADDRVIPILGYSDELPWIVTTDTIYGNNALGWIRNYEKQIMYVQANNLPASSEISSKWETLLNGVSQTDNINDVSPLLTTTWNQGWPYNELCPANTAGPGGHTLVGCVGVTIAQILKYWSDMPNGLGSYDYIQEPYGTISANFNTSYNWAGMPNSITSSDIDVATICYHAAVSCGSEFGPGGTSVGWYSSYDPMRRAYINYFKRAYSSINFVSKGNYSDTAWEDLIKAELNASRPVHYRGDGVGSHQWVCDGYQSVNYFHFNFGWGGLHNGYYYLNDITPGSYNFTNNQMAIIGIKPNDGSTITENTTWGSQTKSSPIAVADSITLTISPGATIQFAGGAHLQIFGNINAIGTANDSISFTAMDTTAGWNGIKVDNQFLDFTVMNDNDSSRFVYCKVSYSDGAGIYLGYFDKVKFNHCYLHNNLSTDHGGAINALQSNLIVDNCLFQYNACTAHQGGAVKFSQYYGSMCYAKITNSIFNGNFTPNAGGAISIGNCTSSTIVDNCIFTNNSAGGAGAIYSAAGTPVIRNCVFCNNSSISAGGAIQLNTSSAYLINLLIANNSALTNGGGAIVFENNSQALVANCNIVNNYAAPGAGGIAMISGANPTFTNTIIWGNASDPGNSIYLDETVDPNFLYSDIQGGVAGFAGPGAGSNYTGTYENNIDSDPFFLTPSEGAGMGYDGLNANWQLLFSSPCIDAGTPDTTGLNLPDLDLAGNSRILNNFVDMGAYEYLAIAPPDPAGPIMGPSFVCFNSMETYTIDSVPGATSYVWTVPYGWTITSGQGTITVLVSIPEEASSGDIAVYGANQGGYGIADTLSVSVGTIPEQPSIISGPASPCEASVVQYTVESVSGINYLWTVPSDWTITSGQGTSCITVVPGILEGILEVFPTNYCGGGVCQSLYVIPLPLPDPTGPIEGPSEVCQGSSNVFTIDTVVNATGYLWTVPGDWSIISGQNTTSITATAGTTSGTISVTANNSCGNSVSSEWAVMVNLLPIANAGSDQSIPFGTSTTLMGSATGGSGSYTWHWEPANLLLDPDIQNPTTVILTTSALFTLTVTDALSACVAADQVIITVTGGPLFVDAIADPNSICAGDLVHLMALVGGGSGSYTYSWTSDPPGFYSNLPDPTVYPLITTIYFVELYDGYGTVNDSIQVTVQPMAPVPEMPNGPDSVNLLEGLETIYTITVYEEASSYIWELTPINAGFISGTDTKGTVTWNPNYLGEATIRVKSVNPCGESAWSPGKITFVDNTTELDDYEDVENQIMVYPNPCKRSFQIRSSVPLSRIILFNQAGKILIDDIKPSAGFAYNISFLHTGLYMIQIHTGDRIATRKIFKIE